MLSKNLRTENWQSDFKKTDYALFILSVHGEGYIWFQNGNLPPPFFLPKRASAGGCKIWNVPGWSSDSKGWAATTWKAQETQSGTNAMVCMGRCCVCMKEFNVKHAKSICHNDLWSLTCVFVRHDVSTCINMFQWLRTAHHTVIAGSTRTAFNVASSYGKIFATNHETGQQQTRRFQCGSQIQPLSDPVF